MAKLFGELTDEFGNELFTICYGGNHIRFLKLEEMMCFLQLTGEIICLTMQSVVVVEFWDCEETGCSESRHVELWELSHMVLRALGFVEIYGERA